MQVPARISQGGAVVPSGMAMHGGGYRTQADHLYETSVGPAIRACIVKYGSSPLPAERLVVHCLLTEALDTCGEGEDAGCAEVARRTVALNAHRAEQVPGNRYEAQAGAQEQAADKPDFWDAMHEVQRRYLHSDAYDEVMQRLDQALQERAIVDSAEADGQPVTAQSLRDMAMGTGFRRAAKALAIQLHAALEQIADLAYQLQPELLDEDGRGRFLQRLDRFYPCSRAVALDEFRYMQLLKDLARYRNARNAAAVAGH